MCVFYIVVLRIDFFECGEKNANAREAAPTHKAAMRGVNTSKRMVGRVVSFRAAFAALVVKKRGDVRYAFGGTNGVVCACRLGKE